MKLFPLNWSKQERKFFLNLREKIDSCWNKIPKFVDFGSKELGSHFKNNEKYLKIHLKNHGILTAQKVGILRTELLHRPFMNFYRPRSEASEGYVFTGVCPFNSVKGQTPPPLARVRGLPHPPDRTTTYPSSLDRTTTSPPPPALCAGGRYASYWNAFLFNVLLRKIFVTHWI